MMLAGDREHSREGAGMARKSSARKGGGTGGGEVVKISVGIDADTHRRLRALAILKDSTGTEIVAELIRKAVEGVRLPSLGYEPPGRAEDAA
jgi:hypothetical protein